MTYYLTPTYAPAFAAGQQVENKKLRLFRCSACTFVRTLPRDPSAEDRAELDKHRAMHAASAFIVDLD